MKKSENERKGLIVWLDGRTEGSLGEKRNGKEKGVYDAKLSSGKGEMRKQRRKRAKTFKPPTHPPHAGFLIEQSKIRYKLTERAMGS